MRKILYLLLLVFIISQIFLGCVPSSSSKPDNIRQEYYEHSKNTISFIDDYIDGKSTYVDMKDKLNDIIDKMYPAQLKETSTETLLKSYFNSLSVTLLAGDDDELLECRNKIADLINETTR